jgi:hypothetical protein
MRSQILEDLNESVIIEREREIAQIEHDIADINEIFRDLSDLVRDQDTILEGLEQHIDRTVDETAQAVEELREADRYHRASSAIVFGLVGFAVGGPVGALCGVKSLLGLGLISLSTGALGYKLRS